MHDKGVQALLSEHGDVIVQHVDPATGSVYIVADVQDSAHPRISVAEKVVPYGGRRGAGPSAAMKPCSEVITGPPPQAGI
jgi:hypothetical protein